MQERVVYETTRVFLTALGHLNYASSQQFAGTARSGFHGEVAARRIYRFPGSVECGLQNAY